MNTTEIADVGSITKKSVSGIFALASRTFFLNIISLAAFLIITSFLTVADIGIYTAVIAIQRVISFFTDVGFGAALIQKKENLTQEDITTMFTIQTSLTLGIFFIILSGLTFLTSIFKLNPEGSMLLVVLVFTIFLSSFKTIPSILLERSINFKKLVIPQIVESLIFNMLLVILVLKQYGLWSFSWAFLISSLIGIPVYYFVSPWKASFRIYKHSLSHFKFGVQFQAKNILATIKDDMLTVILTRFLTFAEIGYIGFAQRLAFFVYRYIVDSVTRVTFPAYARLQHDSAAMRSAIEKSLFFVSCFMFPMLAMLIITAAYIVDYYPKWDNKWEPALFSLVFFCLNAAVSSASGILVNVLDSSGQVKVTLKLMVIWTFLTWSLTPVLISLYGYNGVAVASFLVTLTIFYTIYLTKKVVDFNFWRSIYKPTLAAFIMFFIVYFLALFMVRDIFSLAFVILIGGGVYLGILFLLAKDELKKDLKHLRFLYGK